VRRIDVGDRGLKPRVGIEAENRLSRRRQMQIGEVDDLQHGRSTHPLGRDRAILPRDPLRVKASD
jgi:hypothetical protein